MQASASTAILRMVQTWGGRGTQPTFLGTRLQEGTVRRFMRSAMTITALISLAQPASAGGGNATAAHKCQRGGYYNVVRSDGSTFANTGDCVSYAARGGAFVAWR